ncbi:helix-turn-helix domain-containing protein [Paenibacillus sp. IB182496]|uniref:Helix-turn-helix domain-containing protein n=1 Tax=Paenibacillus sabuli TaxID=2772509 RepID=A0A927GUN8_9BACL|nr:helix-turn-helix domain-containing protein [Paenibacillus sabuli]MBD2848551.1 helix-turn-helix domain-containing protein [Paenibacillus sabuli]
MKRWLTQLGAWTRGWVPQGTPYWRRLVWLGCLSVTLPVIVLGSAYYHFSMDKLKTQFEENSRAALMQLKDRTENEFTRIEYQSMQLALDPLLRHALGQAGFASRYSDKLAILDTLLMRKNANNLVDDILFYEQASDTVLTNAYGGSSLADSPDEADIRAALALGRKEGWHYLPGFRQDGSISYIRQLPVLGGGQVQGLLVYQVRERDIRRTLFNPGERSGGHTMLVLDADDNVLLHASDPSLLGTPAGRDALLGRVLARGETPGQFVVKDARGERQMAMSFTTTLGRTYLSIIPEREMTDQLAWMRLSIFVTVLLILLLGLVLTIASTRLAYSPIDQLIQYGAQLRQGKDGRLSRGENEIDYIRSSLTYLSDQTQSLSRYIARIQPNLRDQFLLRLLTAQSPPGARAVAEEARAYQLPADGRFAVLVVKVDDLDKERRFLPSEGPVIVFALQNVMQELLEAEREIVGYALGKADKEAIAVLRTELRELDEDGLLRQATAYAERVREALLTHLSFSVSIGISGPRAHLAELSDAYREAQLALQQRLLDDSRHLFRYEGERGSAGRMAAFNYPKDLELAIVEYLLQGEAQLAEEQLQAFHARLRASESYNTAMQSYLILLSSIIQSLEEVGYGVLDSIGDNLFEELKARQTFREVHAWFVERLFALHRRMTEEIRTNATTLAVQKVCRHIEAHQGMPSLIECAELVGMSPSYLSRTFKQEAGMSFIEYLMNYKVERAKKLLQDTDHSVMQIAELVGYSERNLNRAFQRHVQMSPKQYRMSLR